MLGVSAKYFLLQLFFPSFVMTEILHDWKVTPKSGQNKIPINMDI